MISSLYAAVARRRREWYDAHPEARRRLRRPVISIGNINSGGRGKTPFTAAVARMLLALGERPAILSRGYGRTRRDEGVVIVRDADGIRADVARAGDEPFMLARQLPGVIVMTSSDRYLAGRLAEHQLGATVHVLDDGFQHFQLDRDADVVLVSGSDLDGVTFPSGRLREPPDALVAADAVVALDTGVSDGSHRAVFRARRSHGTPVFEGTARRPDNPGAGVFAFAGIADPQPFFAAVEAAGLRVAGRAVFRDHHPFSERDLEKIFTDAAASGAAAVMTTEKDYVRLLRYRPFALTAGWLPLTMEPEPLADFQRWLASSIASARDTSFA